MTTSTEKKIPTWLKLTDEGVTITLRYPTELNHVKTDKLVMRAPTIRDVRAANAVSGGDAEKRELQLFSSLTEIPTGDLEGLKVVDYTRVQEGYFRLVDEGEL
ncbi:phage tail assembly protein [Pseudomonas weihenstephanensis]|uniref:phage tail assembly protein n=1 Tax=Pseudomonas weihenstephanensis TaxID=1608994 RepID=UPI00193BD3D3|nr:phage tail assembly protein [Pseudomonas weihenstephanensis]MBM1191594.1 phage tail assembly protein [Pseudomonas weihenstephanensis]